MVNVRAAFDQIGDGWAQLSAWQPEHALESPGLFRGLESALEDQGYALDRIAAHLEGTGWRPELSETLRTLSWRVLEDAREAGYVVYKWRLVP